MSTKSFQIPGTATTPEVSYSATAKSLFISGVSYSAATENSLWNELHTTVRGMQPSDLKRISLQFTGFNIPAAKDIFNLLTKDTKDIPSLDVNWYHEEGDTDMKEAGEDYKGMLQQSDNRATVKFTISEAPKSIAA